MVSNSLSRAFTFFFSWIEEGWNICWQNCAVKLGIVRIYLTFTLTYFSWLFVYSLPTYIYIAFIRISCTLQDCRFQKSENISFIKNLNCEISQIPVSAGPYNKFFHLDLKKNVEFYEFQCCLQVCKELKICRSQQPCLLKTPWAPSEAVLGKSLAARTQFWDTFRLPLGTRELWMETATQLATGTAHTQTVCSSSKLAVREAWCIIHVMGNAQRET